MSPFKLLAFESKISKVDPFDEFDEEKNKWSMFKSIKACILPFETYCLYCKLMG